MTYGNDQGGQQQAQRRGGRTETFTVTNGTSRKVTGLGSVLRCLSATGNLEISIDNGSDRLLFRQGIKRQLEYGDEFTSFTLHNSSGSDVTAVVFIGYGDYADDLTQLTGAVASENLGADAVDDAGSAVTVTTSATQLEAATTNRKFIIIQNTGTTAIAIGFTNAVTFASGIVLEPKGTGNAGGSIELEWTGAVWAIATGSSSEARVLSGKF